MERTTAVLIHGAGGGGWEYDLWRPVFIAAGYEVIAKDLMPAPGGLARTTFADYLKQVTEATPRRGRVVLAGASMGGVLALKAAEQVKPAALILVNSVPPAPVAPPRPRTKYPDVVRWANGPLEDTRAAMPDSDEKTIRWAWKKWRDESGSVMNALSAGITTQKPHCPVLTVLSGKDTDVPYLNGLAIATWANADVQLYRSLSHVGPLMSTRAKEAAQAVTHWLQNRL